MWCLMIPNSIMLRFKQHNNSELSFSVLSHICAYIVFNPVIFLGGIAPTAGHFFPDQVSHIPLILSPYVSSKTTWHTTIPCSHVYECVPIHLVVASIR